MIRVIITQVILFALPFIAFVAYRMATRGPTGAAVADMGRFLFALLVLGGLFVVGGFVYFATVGEEFQGHYVPARYIDGQLIPGRFEPR